MTNYPSGTGPNDPDAPWNDDGPRCEVCDDVGNFCCWWCDGTGAIYAGDDEPDGEACGPCDGSGRIACTSCPTCSGCGERIAKGGHRQCHRIP